MNTQFYFKAPETACRRARHAALTGKGASRYA